MPWLYALAGSLVFTACVAASRAPEAQPDPLPEGRVSEPAEPSRSEGGSLYLSTAERCADLATMAARPERDCAWAGGVVQEAQELGSACDTTPFQAKLREARQIFHGCGANLPPDEDVDPMRRQRPLKGTGP